MSATHACPGCGRPGVVRSKLSCRSCWYRLPADLRRPISQFFRRDPAKHRQALAAAISWYADNRADVVGEWPGGELARVLPLPVLGQVDPLSLGDATCPATSAGYFEPGTEEIIERLVPYHCTRDEAHPMPHVAGDADGRIIATWPPYRVLDEATARRLGIA